MPNLDQTGPNGQGAMSGRGMGKCSQNSEVRGFGRGMGRGKGSQGGRRGRCNNSRGGGQGLGRRGR